MQVVDESHQVIFITRFCAKVLQRQTRLPQAVSNGALDPGQSYRVVPLSHICSCCHGHLRALNVAASAAA
ncbi:hypothetical protein D3C72_2246850 [compost metagenome]